MIDVSELIDDPDFAQDEPFIVTRNIGTWVDGRFTQTVTTINMTGTIIPDTTRQTQQDPHGDMVAGFLKIYTNEELHTTESEAVDGEDRTADEVTWKGHKYRIIKAKNFSDFGYYYAEAVVKLGS